MLRTITATAAVLATAFVVLCTPLTADADTSDTAFEDRIRAYILANPEVILEALEILSEREARVAQEAKISAHPDLFADPPGLGFGASKPELTVVEFFDYRCAPCKALHPKLKSALEAHPQIRVEMRQLPILSPGSERAARFALAVRQVAGDGAYAQVHEDLWHLKGPLRETAFRKIAQKYDLDWQAVAAEMASNAVTERIARNRDIAIDLEILGTPAFVTPTSVGFGGTDAQALVQGWLSQ